MRREKLLKGFGYSAWFSGLFSLFLVWTFPLHLMKDSIIKMAEDALGKGKQGAYGVDPVVQVGKLRVSGFGVKADRVSVQLASRDPDPGPTLDLDTVTAGISPFSLLSSSKSYHLDADLWGGTLDASVSLDDKQNVTRFDADIDDVDLSKATLVLEKLGLPAGGLVSGTASVDLGAVPEKDAAGEVKLKIEGASIGPGNLKMAAAFGGLELPAVDLGNVTVDIPVDKGQGVIKAVKVEGKDAQAELAGNVVLRGKLGQSRVDADGWFGFSKDFLDKNGKMKSALELAEQFPMGGQSLGKAKDDAGHYHFTLKGAVQALQPTLSRDGGKKSRTRPGNGNAGPVEAPPAEPPTPTPG